MHIVTTLYDLYIEHIPCIVLLRNTPVYLQQTNTWVPHVPVYLPLPGRPPQAKTCPPAKVCWWIRYIKCLLGERRKNLSGVPELNKMNRKKTKWYEVMNVAGLTLTESLFGRLLQTVLGSVIKVELVKVKHFCDFWCYRNVQARVTLLFAVVISPFVKNNALPCAVRMVWSA